jgi:hypothetical protein
VSRVAVSKILDEDWIVRAVGAIVLLGSVPTIWAKGFWLYLIFRGLLAKVRVQGGGLKRYIDNRRWFTIVPLRSAACTLAAIRCLHSSLSPK